MADDKNNADDRSRSTPQRFAVCWSGGSGVAYGQRLVGALLELGHEVHLTATGAARRVLRHEAGVADVHDLAALFPAALRARLTVHALAAVESTPASGSARLTATIIVPCSMGTLARVAHGWSSNLVERAADVAIKEGRPLVVVPRETPLSIIHLENMLKLARLGVVVLPAMPGFYHRPQTIAELVDFVVGKILDRLGIEHDLFQRWETPVGDRHRETPVGDRHRETPTAADGSPFDEGEDE